MLGLKCGLTGGVAGTLVTKPAVKEGCSSACALRATTLQEPSGAANPRTMPTPNQTHKVAHNARRIKHQDNNDNKRNWDYYN